MKKLILSLSIVAVVSLSATAQKHKESTGRKTEFSIGGVLGIPVGNLSPYASLAYGGDLQVEFPVAPTFGVTVSGGYIGFSAKSGYSISGGLIPVLAGGKYYFTPKFHGDGQLGVSFVTNSGGGGNSSVFTYALGAGYMVSNNFDLAFKYQSATKNGADNSFIGLRIAYIFK
jgi:hypothetical protein